MFFRRMVYNFRPWCAMKHQVESFQCKSIIYIHVLICSEKSTYLAFHSFDAVLRNPTINNLVAQQKKCHANVLWPALVPQLLTSWLTLSARLQIRSWQRSVVALDRTQDELQALLHSERSLGPACGTCDVACTSKNPFCTNEVLIAKLLRSSKFTGWRR